MEAHQIETHLDVFRLLRECVAQRFVNARDEHEQPHRIRFRDLGHHLPRLGMTVGGHGHDLRRQNDRE